MISESIHVIVETAEGLQRKMRVIVPAEEVEGRITEKIKQTAKQARINGFRPGKVPVREVKRRYGADIRREVSSRVVESSYSEALRQKALNPAGLPDFEDMQVEEGKDLEYTAVFEVMPETEVQAFDGITIERISSRIEESDIDNMVELLREQRVTYTGVDRPGMEKDRVNVDFKGFLGEEAIEDAGAEGVDIVIGAGHRFPGLDVGLAGLAAGDEKEIAVSFPEDYAVQGLAGKEAVFKVSVNSVSAPQKPELDDRFFEQFDVTEGGAEAFRAAVKDNMQHELDNAIRAKMRRQVLDGLDAANEVELPRTLIEQTIDHLRREAVMNFGGGDKVDPASLPAEIFTEQAKRQVKVTLLTRAIVDRHRLELDDARVREKIEAIAGQYEHPSEVVKYYYDHENLLGHIRNQVLEDQIVDLILASARVTEKTVSYDEAVRPTPAGEVKKERAPAP